MNATSGNPFSFNPTKLILAECTIGVAVNSLLLIVIIRNPLRNLRKRSWLTITNLAVADLLTSAATMLLSHYDMEERKEEGNILTLKFSYAFIHIGYSASFFMLLLFSIEVYIATKNPLHCHLILTRNKVLWASAGFWLLAVLIGSSHFWSDAYPMEIIIICIGVLELAVVVVIILRILVILNVRKSRRHIADQIQSGSHTSRLTVTFLLLFVVYMITAFPYFVIEQIHFLSHSKPEWKINFEHDFIVYYLPIAYVNFMVNPLIYAWRMPDYRRALVALVTCRKRLKRAPNVVVERGSLTLNST